MEQSKLTREEGGIGRICETGLITIGLPGQSISIKGQLFARN
jgi:hypothetical protein